ncbi:MAG: hypothetical protein FJ297_07450 [Planctomycetes bacterium]|nr:hypothetical protein [Planctomycetota bacterium]
MLAVMRLGKKPTIETCHLNGAKQRENTLSREPMEAHRRMSNEQRLQLPLRMIRAATFYWLQGTPEQVDRKAEP